MNAERVSGFIEKLTEANDNIYISEITWIVIFVMYWIASMILTYMIPVAIGEMIEYYNVIPSQFSVLLFNIAGWLEIAFAIYIVVFTIMFVYENREPPCEPKRGCEEREG